MQEYIDSVYENVNCNAQSRSGDSRGRSMISRDRIRLYQSYPDPFNAATEMRYYLPTEADVRLEVYNLLGQKVQTLLNEQQLDGEHSVTWNASGFASGIYFYKLKVGGETLSKRMTLLK